MHSQLPKYSDQYSLTVTNTQRPNVMEKAVKSIGAFVDENGVVNEDEIASFVQPLLGKAKSQMQSPAKNPKQD